MGRTRHYILLLVVLVWNIETLHAQEKNLNYGTEQDVLPWITGGYYASAWIGKNHVRARSLVAHVHKPSFITPEGFENNTVTAYAFLGEYFYKTGWTGLSATSGLVYWKSTIQREGYINTKKYENMLLHGSLSWAFRLSGHFYIAPWAGMHLRIGGAKSVSIDGASFKTPILNPEASIKAGFWF